MHSSVDVRPRLKALDEDLAAFESTTAARRIKPKSKFAQQRQKEKTALENANPRVFNLQSASEKHAGLIGEITERKIMHNVEVAAPTMPAYDSRRGFPTSPASRVSPLIKRELQSSFSAQYFNARDDVEADDDMLHADIGRETDDIIASLSPQEVIEAQQEIRAMLTPGQLDSLLHRQTYKGSQSRGPAKELLTDRYFEHHHLHGEPVASTSHTAADQTYNSQGIKIVTRSVNAVHVDEHHSHQPNEFTLDRLSALIRSTMIPQRVNGLLVSSRVLSNNRDDKAVDSFIESILPTLCTYLHQSAHVGLLNSTLNLLLTILQRQNLIERVLTQEPFLLDAFSHLAAPTSPFQNNRSAIDNIVRVLLLCAQPATIGPDSILSHPDLLENLTRFCLEVNWPSADQVPIPCIFDLLNELVVQSRSNASHITNLRFLDAALRYLVHPFWKVQAIQIAQIGQDILTHLFGLLTNLAKYGLSLAARSSIWLTQFETHLPPNLSSRVSNSWHRLLSAWITAAQNPHKQTPEHTLLWADVQILHDHLLAKWNSIDFKDIPFLSLQAGYLEAICSWNSAISQSHLPGTLIGLEQKDLEQFLQALPSEIVSTSQDTVLSIIRLAITSSLTMPGSKCGQMLQSILAVPRTTVNTCLATSLVSCCCVRDREIFNVLQMVDCQTLDCCPTLFHLLMEKCDTKIERALYILKPLFTHVESDVCPYILSATSMQETKRLTALPSDQFSWTSTWPLTHPIQLLYKVETASLWKKLPNSWLYSEKDILIAALEIQKEVITVLSRDQGTLYRLPTIAEVLDTIMNLYLLLADEARPSLSPSAGDVFLDEEFSAIALELLQTLPVLQTGSVKDASASFKNFQALVDIYQASSYGNSAFTYFLQSIVFDTRLFPVDFRKLVIVDHSDILPLLSQPTPAHLRQIPLPKETDRTTLSTLRNAQQSNVISESKHPGLIHFIQSQL